VKHSEKQLARILRSSNKEQEKYFEEAWNQMSEAERRRFWAYLDEELNTFSETNMKRERSKMRKYNRTRSRRRTS
jgi:hypothetical protein